MLPDFNKVDWAVLMNELFTRRERGYFVLMAVAGAGGGGLGQGLT